MRNCPHLPSDRTAAVGPSAAWHARWRRFAIGLALLPALTGCPSETTTSNDAGTVDGGADGTDETIAVVVGGSDEPGQVFVDWPETGASAPMIRGPQGGQHVWVSVRTRGLWPKKMRLDVQMTAIDTEVVVKPGKVPLLLSLSPGPDGYDEVIGVTAYVKCPCQVKDRKLRVDVDVVDLYGLVGHGTGYVTPTWDGDCSIDPVGSCAQQ